MVENEIKGSIDRPLLPPCPCERLRLCFELITGDKDRDLLPCNWSMLSERVRLICTPKGEE
jgi:hypothetical protein